MTARGWSRRQLLKALGVPAAAAPLVPLLDRDARAAAPPRRLLLVFSPNGTVADLFWPRGSGGDFAFPAGGILEPLAPFQRHLVIPRDLRRAFHPAGGDHQRGIGCLWTGARLNQGDLFGGGWASGPSIDQIIGKALPLETSFRTLEVAVGAEFQTQAKGFMVYAGSDRPMAAEGSPRRLFARLTGGSAADRASATAAWRRRRSVIDVVKGDLADLRRKIDRSDAFKVDAHLQAVRSIEARLQAADDEAARPAQAGERTCDVAPVTSDGADFATTLALQSDLVVSAFACDRTRVATLQWDAGGGTVRHAWAGQTTDHHTLSHDTSPQGQAALVAINRWYAQQLAHLLEALSAVREGDGTLLDDTLVVWANELGEGASHNPSPEPVVMAGALGGRVRTGRVVDTGGSADWNQLLVTLCHAMGVFVDRVGDLGGSGPVPGVLA